MIFFTEKKRIGTEKETGRGTRIKRKTKTGIGIETGKTGIGIGTGVRTKTKIGIRTETRTEKEGPAASHATVTARRGASQGSARRSPVLAPETATAGESLAPGLGTGAASLVPRSVAAPGAEVVIAAAGVEVGSVGGVAAGTIAAPGPGAKLLNSM